MHVIIFDDEKWENFKPLTYTRSIGDLRVGILKLRQRLLAFAGSDENAVIIPTFLKKLYKERHPEWDINVTPVENCLFINSRLKVNEAVLKLIESLKPGDRLVSGDEVVAFCVKGTGREVSSETLMDLWEKCEHSIYCEAQTWHYSWEFIQENSVWIKRDFEEFFYDKDNYFETEMGVTVLNPYNVWLGEGVTLKPGVVIDASEGPVVIDENVNVMPNAVIIGPSYIGKNTIVKIGAKIYEGTSIGPRCKIGGEVEETVVQGYSNKQHDGFLGHSFIGEWVNIGADTNNSDLKNNYGHVKMYFYPDSTKVNTNNQFLGCIIGDHTKIGINCTINTGAVIGTACNLYGREMISDFIPDFSWGEGNSFQSYKKANFMDTARIVKSRRKLLFTKSDEEIFEYILENK